MFRIRLIAALLILIALGYLIVQISNKAGKLPEEGQMAVAVLSGLSPYKTSEDCKGCHSQIYDEWRHSLHAISATDPVLQVWLGMGSNGWKAAKEGNPECNLCHVPANIFEGVLGEYPKSRGVQNDVASGVTCLTCHVMGANVLGVQGLSGPCNPVNDARLTSAKFCGTCHQNQQIRMRRKHEWEEWKERSVYTKDKSCVDCHMVEIERPIADGAPVRTGHDHRMSVIRNPEFMRKAFDVDLQVIDRRVVIAIRNKGTGHKMPTGYRIREHRFIATIEDESGEVIWEGRYGVHRKSRQKGEDTQIADYDIRIHRFDPLPDEIQAGTVKLRCDFEIAPLGIGGPPTVIYEKEQTFPHEARPLPEEKKSDDVPTTQLVEDTNRLQWLGIVLLLALLLWVLGWYARK